MPFDGRGYLSPSAAAILEGARSRVERGWAHGRARDLGDGVCVLVAVYEASKYVLESYEEPVALLASAINSQYESSTAIIFFNDAPHRTKEEVLALFDGVLGKRSAG